MESIRPNEDDLGTLLYESVRIFERIDVGMAASHKDQPFP
jgi:hypothetical protein